jgi:hypothetical protein
MAAASRTCFRQVGWRASARVYAAAVKEALTRGVADAGGRRHGNFNAAFKAKRKVDPSIRYAELMLAKQAAMIEAVARAAAG